MVQEDITKGQLVERFHVEAILHGKQEWETIATSTTIGHKRIIRLPQPVTAKAVRIVIDEARAEPNILSFSVHRATMR